MKKAVINRRLSELFDNSDMTAGEIIYSILVHSKPKNVSVIRSLQDADILFGVEREIKAINDTPMSDEEWEKYITKHFEK